MNYIESLRKQWINLTFKYSKSDSLIQNTFDQIKNQYNAEGRFYHTLNHISEMLIAITPFEKLVDDYNSILFAIWFHDIIYDPKRSDNEEKSAKYARGFLTELKYDSQKIDAVMQMIMVTKNHQIDVFKDDYDTKLFLDLDLLILGAKSDIYRRYSENVRKEYIFVPEQVYSKERAKILTNFLKQGKVFSTKEFHEAYETIARQNIQTEIDSLLKLKFD